MSKLEKKLLKTDRTARLAKVAHHRSQKPRPGFTITLSIRPCVDVNECAIYQRIAYFGQDTGPYSLGIKANRVDVNTKDFSVNRDEMKTFLLRGYKARIESLIADCRLTGRTVDVFAIRDSLFADDRLVASIPNIKELVDSWLAHDQARKDAGEIVERTRWKNKRWTNDFWAFVLYKYGPNARLSDVKAADIRSFIIWLKQVRKLSNNVAQSTAAHAKQLMNYALDNEWVEKNTFVNFRRKVDTVERETLSEEEINLFCTFSLESPALSKVRAIFFFMLLTGLSYADVERLTTENIKTQNGAKYIHILRRKMLSRSNTVPAMIPLTAPALNILEIYGSTLYGEPLLLLQANAPFNRGLKQIAAMCGLEKSISTKVARNSLATYLINKGVPLISVSAILGHSSTMTTQKYYAKVSPERVLNDMSDLNDRLKSSGLFGIDNS